MASQETDSPVDVYPRGTIVLIVNLKFRLQGLLTDVHIGDIGKITEHEPFFHNFPYTVWTGGRLVCMAHNEMYPVWIPNDDESRNSKEIHLHESER